MNADELIDACYERSHRAEMIAQDLFNARKDGQPVEPKYVSKLNEHAQALSAAAQKLDLLCKGYQEPKVG